MEVMNEPFVHAAEIPASKEDISELHNAVAKRVHELAPDVMVGGYTSAWPEFEGGDFNQWNDNWNENPGSSTYRAGANSEAILDMIEHYSYLTLGEVKPFNILLRQADELEGETGTHWVYTELVQFFQLWSDVKGTRIDTHPTDPDIQVDAYVERNKVYVILNNLEFNDVVIDQSSEEIKYYADKYLQPIRAGEASSFVIDGVETGDIGEATLRLGLGRDHGRSLQPTVLFNGDTLDIPRDIRGYDQHTRARFFGILEIPVPYESVKESNNISVSFEDGGGHISSVSLQSYLQSKELIRTPPQSKFDAKFTILDKNSEMVIEGAEVIFAGDTAYADELGVVRFDSVSQGTYPLLVSMANYFSFSNPSFAHYTYTESQLKLSPRTYDLFFKVLEDVLDVPVYNATVQLGEWILLTNGEGIAGQILEKGTYAYSISEPYFETVSGRVDLFGDTLIDIQLLRMLADVKFRIYSNEGSQSVYFQIRLWIFLVFRRANHIQGNWLSLSLMLQEGSY